MPPTPSLTGLLPALLRRHLADLPEAPLAFHASHFPAASLIADVSGFTSLAERLAARGPEGVEELSRLVNRWFGAMVDIIEAHGGDVIRFAGDAPIVVFPAARSESTLGPAIARATACGTALCLAMQALRTPDADVTVHVGIGAGDVTAVVAGGTGEQWEFVVGGAPLVEMSVAERRAAPGEVRLGERAETLRDSSSVTPGTRLADGLGEITTEALRAFVPPAVAALVDAGSASWAAELRRVSVLFLGLQGLDLDASDGPRRLHDALRALQASVFEQGGQVSQFLMDDKGITLVASWGVAGHRHEDDAVRAARAAMAARVAILGLGLTSRAGISTGRAFCGWRGNESRREYALIGATVNRAARLMTATIDDLRVDEPTVSAASAVMAFDVAEPLTLKGTDGPVTTFRPRPETDGALARPVREEAAATVEMVGRRAERRALADALSSLRRGDSATLVIRGEAGMGKSTLVQDFLTTARALGVTSAFGAVASSSSAGPYRPWRAVLRTILGLDVHSNEASHRGAGDEARIADLREALAQRSGADRFAPLVAEVLGLPLADNEWTSPLVQQARVEKTRDVVVGLLLDAATRQPLTVVLDNLHWMDSLSTGLALAVQRRVTPLLLVLVTRPLGADVAADVADLLGSSATQMLDLSRLAADDVRRLMCQRLSVSHVPDELVALVEEKAGGYPLFVGELVVSLLDAGVVATKGSACVLPDSGAPLRAHRFPDSVHGAIADRLDRLAPREQLTMKVASAIGAPVDAASVGAVHPLQLGQADVRADFDVLTQRGFLVRADERGYTFGHAVMQDVAYGLLLGDQRRALHRAIAEWYGHARPHEIPAAVMAHHWTEAEDTAQSLDWLERAGTEASRLGGLRDTLRHFGRAFEIASRDAAHVVPPSRRVRWMRFTGHAHAELGAMDTSTTHLTDALTLMGRGLPATPRAMSVRLGREAIRQTAILAGVLRAPARLSDDARTQAIEEAELLRMLGKIAFYAQDHLRYITASLQSINIAERAGARETAASAYAALGYIVAMFGLERLAARWWRLAEASGELDAQLNSQIGRMMYLNSHTRWKESMRVADEQADLIARVGSSLSLPSHLMIRGFIHLHHGRYAEGVDAASKFLDWGLAANHLQQAFATHLQLAGLWLERGRMAEARQHVAEAEALAPRIGDPIFLSIYHGVAVDVCLETDDLEAAKGPAHALREVIAKSPPYFGSMSGYVAMTNYGLARWRRATGGDVAAIQHETKWAHRALKKHASLNPYARPRAWMLEGSIAACEGRFTRAHRSWLRGLALAEKCDMPREVAYAHASLAQWSRLPAEQRRVHYREATSRFAAMGSPHQVAALELTAASSR